MRYGAATFIDADGVRTPVELVASSDAVEPTLTAALLERATSTRFPSLVPLRRLRRAAEVCPPKAGVGTEIFD